MMKVEVFDKWDDVVLTLTIRSDVFSRNSQCDDSDMLYISNLINRYCSSDEGNYRIGINGDTLPNDPNTDEGRKLFNSRNGFDE